MCEKCVELGKSVQMWAEKVAEAQEKDCGNLVHHLEDSLAVAHIKYVDARNACEDGSYKDTKSKVLITTEVNGVVTREVRVYDATRFDKAQIKLIENVAPGLEWRVREGQIVTKAKYEELTSEKNKQELKKLDGYVTEKELWELALTQLNHKIQRSIDFIKETDSLVLKEIHRDNLRAYRAKRSHVWGLLYGE